MSKKACSKCNTPFECGHEKSGCWCEQYTLSKETLKKLEKEFENCLCPDCLKTFAENPARS